MTDLSTLHNVLLVDDNQEILDFISDDLSDEYRVHTARNGEIALRILEEAPIDVVVSDVMMPLMDGFELCRHIKASPTLCHLPVILLTAKNTLQSKIEGLERGADAYIEKPFSPAHLQVQIANLINNRQKLIAHLSKQNLEHNENTEAAAGTDDELMNKLLATIESNLANPELDVDQLAELLNMSRPTLYRRIKASSQLTPNELINASRLKRAAELLREGKYKIYEIAAIVGYSSQTQFGRSFFRHYGMSPSNFLSSLKAGGAPVLAGEPL